MKSLCVFIFLAIAAATAYGQRGACCATPPAAGNLTVLVFLAVDCPISQKYIPVLNAIQKKYENSPVRFEGLITGSVKARDLEKFSSEYAILFPLKTDKDLLCARQMSAEVTPEVFVFDDKCEIKYRGAIDNWFYDLGGYRKESTEDYLIDAVDALLKGNDPEVRTTKAIGCLIQAPVKKHGAH